MAARGHWRRACPHCGYDLSGVIAAWRDACPLSGTCSECGGAVAWPEVMQARLPAPAWSLEHAPDAATWWRRFPGVLGRAVTTAALVDLAWCDEGEERVRCRRLAAGLGVLAAGLALSTGVAFVLAGGDTGVAGIALLVAAHGLACVFLAFFLADGHAGVGIGRAVGGRMIRRGVLLGAWPTLAVGWIVPLLAALSGPARGLVLGAALVFGLLAPISWAFALQRRLYRRAGAGWTRANAVAAVLLAIGFWWLALFAALLTGGLGFGSLVALWEAL